MRRNLLAVFVAFLLLCMLSLSTVVIDCAFYHQITVEMKKIEFPPGHVSQRVNMKD